MQETTQKALFSLGQLVATPGALASLAKAGQTPLDFLSRHVCGDWGDLDKDDCKENELGLKRGFRILSRLTMLSGQRLMLAPSLARSQRQLKCQLNPMRKRHLLTLLQRTSWIACFTKAFCQDTHSQPMLRLSMCSIRLSQHDFVRNINFRLLRDFQWHCLNMRRERKCGLPENNIPPERFSLPT